MNNKLNINSLLVGILLGAVAVICIAAATGAGGRTSWEYKIIAQPQHAIVQALEQPLNDADKDGWEVVGVSHSEREGTFALMKRPKK